MDSESPPPRAVLDPDRRWRRAMELFEACLEIPRDDRPAFLQDATGDDVDLRRRVESLLARDDTSNGFLEPPPTADRTHGAGEPPVQVGRYRLVAAIGEGGMGRVYRAEPVGGDPAHPVAVKLLRRGEDSRAASQLEIEREVLGRLEHPYICRLLDAGTTEDSTPWVATELVRGEPLIAYCDERRLGTRQRLELFLKVLDAVEYAHANMVVHCDLKPSNILVTERGHPKLLDFGIAAHLAGEPRPTTAGGAAFTPSYASPEQLRRDRVTPATDIFSLGVMLHQLLCGRLPALIFARRGRDGQKPGSSPGPSSLLSEDSTVRAEQWLSTAKSEDHRRLNGDIAAIVAYAMAERPDDRYRSVSLMAADIERHLRYLPVLARTQTLRYRWSRFVRRRRLPLSLAVAAATCALVIIMQTISLARERNEAEALRSRADSTLRLLTDSLADLDPGRAGKDDLTAAALVERATQRVEQSQVGDPAVHASLLHELGRLQSYVGNYERAVGLLRHALDLRRTLDDKADLAETLDRLSEVEVLAGHYAEAEAAAREAVSIRAAEPGADAEATATSLHNLAYALLRNSREEEARLAEAEAVALRALELQKSSGNTPPSGDPDTLQLLASLLRQRGRPAEALPFVDEALSDRRRNGSPRELAIALNDAALVRLALGETDAALALQTESTDLLAATLGDHPDVATALNNLAMNLETAGRGDEAEERFREALPIYRRLLPEDHSLITNGLAGLAHLLVWQGRPAEAEELLTEVVGRLERRLEPTHPFLAYGRALLAEAMARRGNQESALDQLELAMAARDTFDSESWMAASFESLEGGILGEHEPSARAEELLARSFLRLHELQGEHAQPTDDARRRLERYRARWNGTAVQQAR
jgi:serine/threonine-protein kinase